MSPTFVVTQTAPNGPGGKPHYAVDGPWNESEVQAIKEGRGDGFVKTVEADDLKGAWGKAGPCPACAEGLKIINASPLFRRR